PDRETRPNGGHVEKDLFDECGRQRAAGESFVDQAIACGTEGSGACAKLLFQAATLGHRELWIAQLRGVLRLHHRELKVRWCHVEVSLKARERNESLEIVGNESFLDDRGGQHVLRTEGGPVRVLPIVDAREEEPYADRTHVDGGEEAQEQHTSPIAGDREPDGERDDRAIATQETKHGFQGDRSVFVDGRRRADLD